MRGGMAGTCTGGTCAISVSTISRQAVPQSLLKGVPDQFSGTLGDHTWKRGEQPPGVLESLARC